MGEAHATNKDRKHISEFGFNKLYLHSLLVCRYPSSESMVFGYYTIKLEPLTHNQYEIIKNVFVF